MPTATCECGQRLFRNNTTCTVCGRRVGRCDQCGATTVLGHDSDCACRGCGCELRECGNRARYNVCTSFIAADSPPEAICGRCLTTTLTPDPTDAAALAKWSVLEAAKRRLLDELDAVGLDAKWREGEPPLRFRFAADTPNEKLMTGHANGVITINTKEADSVHREVERLRLGEPQRTVIGHLRHEFGHYLDLRIDSEALRQSRDQLFGDPTAVDYGAALESNYDNGPPAGWEASFISPYASVHPWEDFAETAAFYLDMLAVLMALSETSMLKDEVPEEFDAALQTFESAALALNEVNRAMGLTDLVPQVVPPPVVEKLRLIHRVVSASGVRKAPFKSVAQTSVTSST